MTQSAFRPSLKSVLTTLLTCASAVNAKTKTFCGQYDEVNTTSNRYTILSNQWGAKDHGVQCTTAELGGADDTFCSFNVTWQWYDKRTTVHTFPSALLNSKVIPIQISDLTSLDVNGSWILITDPKDNVTDPKKLAAAGARVDVALDLFIDSDPEASSNTSAAATEIMIWQAVYGDLLPIGSADDNPATVDVDDVTYTLYTGKNQNKQDVYSWVPTKNQTQTDTNLFPLVDHLLQSGFIKKDQYLGRMQFGQETMHSEQGHNVTFVLNYLEMNVNNEKWDDPKTSGGDKKGAAASSNPSLTIAFATCMASLAWLFIGA